MPNPEGINQYGSGSGSNKPSANDRAKVAQAHVRAAAAKANEHYAQVNRLHDAGRHQEAQALAKKGY